MKRKKYKVIKDYIFIYIGTIIASIAINGFLVPSNLAPGGATGTAILINYVTNIPVGTLIFCINIPIFLLGVKVFGKAYGAKTLAGIVFLSGNIELVKYIYPNISKILDFSNPTSVILGTLYGGVLMGVGLGTVMKNGGTTGGSDIIAGVLNKYLKIPMGQGFMMVDSAVVMMAAYIFGAEKALYALINLYATGIVINKIIIGMDSAKMTYVVTSNVEAVRKIIVEDLGKTGNLSRVEALFTHSSRNVITTVLRTREVHLLKELIAEVDKEAFVVVSDVHEVMGRGYTFETNLNGKQIREEKLVKIKEKIEKANNILITGHINPDGDTIGAGLALLKGIEKTYPKKEVDFILEDPVPRNIKFLKGSERIKGIEDADKNGYDLAICVDAATIDRIGKVADLIKDTFIINLDHHISNTNYGNINCVREISSTSELVYRLLTDIGIEFDVKMGEAIYLGLVNDTGNFAHSNVTENTLKIASELVKIGVNNNKIVSEFYKSKTIEKIKLQGKVFSEMKYNEEKKLAYFYLTAKDMDELGIDKSDTEGVVEELLSYDKCEVSLFLREEKNGRIKGSLRSKYNQDVNKIAALFGGGGHIKAAGFSSDLSADEVIEKVLKNL